MTALPLREHEKHLSPGCRGVSREDRLFPRLLPPSLSFSNRVSRTFRPSGPCRGVPPYVSHVSPTPVRFSGRTFRSRCRPVDCRLGFLLCSTRCLFWWSFPSLLLQGFSWEVKDPGLSCPGMRGTDTQGDTLNSV